MRSSTRISLMIALAVLPVWAIGDEPAKPVYPEVDASEVLRRGNAVVVAGEGPRGAAEDAMIQATAPPPDDSYKWFIVVIKQQNCEPCAKLLADFQRAPELLAFVTAAEPYKPWGHFLVYDRADATQQYRLKNYKVAGYPTIVIQPPLSGVWGPPGTVVWQDTGYDGNPRKLAQSITAYVRAYASAMSRKGYPRPPSTDIKSDLQRETDALTSTLPRFRIPVVVGGARQADGHTAGPTGPPPFNQPPKVDPFNPQPYAPNNPQPLVPGGQWPPLPSQPTVDPNKPPDQAPVSWATILSLLMDTLAALTTGHGTTNLLLLIIAGLKVMERVAPLTKTTIDDKVVALLE